MIVAISFFRGFNPLKIDSNCGIVSFAKTTPEAVIASGNTSIFKVAQDAKLFIEGSSLNIFFTGKMTVKLSLFKENIFLNVVSFSI